MLSETSALRHSVVSSFLSSFNEPVFCSLVATSKDGSLYSKHACHTPSTRRAKGATRLTLSAPRSARARTPYCGATSHIPASLPNQHYPHPPKTHLHKRAGTQPPQTFKLFTSTSHFPVLAERPRVGVGRNGGPTTAGGPTHHATISSRFSSIIIKIHP